MSVLNYGIQSLHLLQFGVQSLISSLAFRVIILSRSCIHCHFFGFQSYVPSVQSYQFSLGIQSFVFSIRCYQFFQFSVQSHVFSLTFRVIMSLVRRSEPSSFHSLAFRACCSQPGVQSYHLHSGIQNHRSHSSVQSHHFSTVWRLELSFTVRHSDPLFKFRRSDPSSFTVQRSELSFTVWHSEPSFTVWNSKSSCFQLGVQSHHLSIVQHLESVVRSQAFRAIVHIQGFRAIVVHSQAFRAIVHIQAFKAIIVHSLAFRVIVHSLAFRAIIHSLAFKVVIISPQFGVQSYHSQFGAQSRRSQFGIQSPSSTFRRSEPSFTFRCLKPSFLHSLALGSIVHSQAFRAICQLGIQSHHIFSLAFRAISQPSIRCHHFPLVRRSEPHSQHLELSLSFSSVFRATLLAFRVAIFFQFSIQSHSYYLEPLSSVLGVHSHVISLTFRVIIFFILAFGAIVLLGIRCRHLPLVLVFGVVVHTHSDILSHFLSFGVQSCVSSALSFIVMAHDIHIHWH